MSAYRVHWFASQTRFSIENRFRMPPVLLAVARLPLRFRPQNISARPLVFARFSYYITSSKAEKRGSEVCPRPASIGLLRKPDFLSKIASEYRPSSSLSPACPSASVLKIYPLVLPFSPIFLTIFVLQSGKKRILSPVSHLSAITQTEKISNKRLSFKPIVR
jgi:hypothetical protein